MKKRILTMLLVLTVSTGALAGCSSWTNGVQSDEATQEDNGAAESGSTEEDASELTGTLDEIKDFMFVVTDDDGISYAFPFEEKPENLEQMAVGDKVIVKYTGTLSEVDPFTGEILSIEKQE